MRSRRSLMSALDASVDLVAVRGAIPALLQMADPGIVEWRRVMTTLPSLGQAPTMRAMAAAA
jgi:hypothetical protein